MAAYFNEFDPFAAAWLRELIKAGHIAQGDVDDRSILDVSPDDLRGYDQCHFFAGIGVWSYSLRRAGWADDRPVWTGSAPCQPLSVAGLGKGHADERHLWPAFHRLIAECRPPVVLGEQVAGKDGREWFSAVRADLEADGYACGGADLCAAGVGAPHIRQRLYWLAHADDPRLEGRRQPQCQRAGQRLAGAGGVAGGLADAISDDHRSEVQAADHRQPQADGPADRAGGYSGSFGRPGTADGWWSDADWLYCRDGRWRPVVASHVALVDGPSAAMVRMRHQGTRTDQGKAGEEVDVEGKPQPHEGGANGEAILRDMREHGQAARSPQGREPAQQRPVELDDVVSLLSPSLSLAELYRDGNTAAELRALRQAILSAGAVLHPSVTAQEVWASLGQEAQADVRRAVDFDASRWVIVVPFPLEHGAAARVGRLRGYGNAIVAPLAQTFIESVMDITSAAEDPHPSKPQPDSAAGQ